jgi:hypothetical protein
LKTVYLSEEIRVWVVGNLNRLTEPIMGLVAYLEKSYEPEADKVLQISRVCKLPDDLSLFVQVCRRLIRSKRWPWLNASLIKTPEQ